MTHPSFGVLTKEEFEQARNAPAGGAAQIIRKKDPIWGLVKGETKTFKVEVSKKVYRTDTATVEVEACDEKQAETIIDNMDWDDFKWSEGYDEDEDDHEIYSVKEAAK